MRLKRHTVVSIFALPAAALLAVSMLPSAASAAPAASGASGPVWSTQRTSTTNCPASVHVLAPSQGASYFKNHPQDLLVPGGFHAGGAATARLLAQVATRPMHWQTAITCQAGRPGRPVPRHSTQNATSANWSGYWTDKPDGYVGATMEWPVHAVSNTTNVDAYSSTWPGIGTGTSQRDALIQAGVQQELPCSVAQGQRSCKAQTNTPWFEIYPQEAEQDIANLPIKTSDLVGVIVEYDPLAAEAYFEIDDLTSNTGVYMYQDVAGDSNGVVGSGSQAEWIVERPGICFIICNTSELVNFGTQPIIYAEAAAGDWSAPDYTTVSQDAPEAVAMHACPGGSSDPLLASPGSITSNEDFNVTWHAYGSIDDC
jgi:hypothetical protein